MDALANSMFEFLGQTLRVLMTFWMNVPPPDLVSSGSVVTQIGEWTRPLSAASLIVGLLVAGGRLAWSARWDEGAEVLKSVLITAGVAGAGAGLIAMLLLAFDEMSTAVMTSGFNGIDVGKRIAEFAAGSGATSTLGAGLASILFTVAGLSSLVQAGFMLMRGPILVLLVGIWPLAAASMVTRSGSEWFKRITAWLFSWVIYKFVAALVYASAFALIGDSKDLTGVTSGGLLLCLSILALPALMRLISPAVSAIGGGGGSGLLAGAAGAAATGAVAMGSRGSAPTQTHPVGKVAEFSQTSSPSGPPAIGSSAGPSGSQVATRDAGSSGAAPGGAGAGASGASGAGAAGAAGSSGAAAAAAGPAGAAVAAAGQIKAAAQSAANGAIEGGDQS
jgi:hypothetical protein